MSAEKYKWIVNGSIKSFKKDDLFSKSNVTFSNEEKVYKYNESVVNLIFNINKSDEVTNLSIEKNKNGYINKITFLLKYKNKKVYFYIQRCSTAGSSLEVKSNKKVPLPLNLKEFKEEVISPMGMNKIVCLLGVYIPYKQDINSLSIADPIFALFNPFEIFKSKSKNQKNIINKFDLSKDEGSSNRYVSLKDFESFLNSGVEKNETFKKYFVFDKRINVVSALNSYDYIKKYIDEKIKFSIGDSSFKDELTKLKENKKSNLELIETLEFSSELDDEFSFEDLIYEIEDFDPETQIFTEFKTNKLKRNSIIIEEHKNSEQNLFCFSCGTDKTFKENDNSRQYFEVHHAIPYNLLSQNQFKKNLDSSYNLVSLCPTCHRKIHLADSIEREEVIIKIYESKLKNETFTYNYKELKSVNMLMKIYKETFKLND